MIERILQALRLSPEELQISLAYHARQQHNAAPAVDSAARIVVSQPLFAVSTRKKS